MERLGLYPEFVTVRNTHVSIWYVKGLPQSSQDLLSTELDELICYRDLYKGQLQEPELPNELVVESLQAKLLRHFDTSTLLSPKTNTSATRRVSQIDFEGRAVGAIGGSPQTFIIQDGSWDQCLLDGVCSFCPTADPPSPYTIASIAGSGGGNKQGQGRTQGRAQHYSTRIVTEKPVPCPYGPCGRIHPPNICFVAL